MNPPYYLKQIESQKAEIARLQRLVSDMCVLIHISGVVEYTHEGKTFYTSNLLARAKERT